MKTSLKLVGPSGATYVCLPDRDRTPKTDEWIECEVVYEVRTKGEVTRYWGRDKAGKWHQSDVVEVPNRVIDFKHIEEWYQQAFYEVKVRMNSKRKRPA